MMGSMELKPAERNTETMKDVERNLLRESCRKKPVEREIVARARDREIKQHQCLLCLCQACSKSQARHQRKSKAGHQRKRQHRTTSNNLTRSIKSGRY